MRPKDILTKELLEEEYVKNRLSVHKIADKYGIKSSNSVTQSLKRYNIFRDTTRPINTVDENWLYQKYITEDYSAFEIAKMLGIVSKESVLDRLDKFGIKKRGIGQLTKHFYESHFFEEVPLTYFKDIQHGAKRRNVIFEVDIEYIWSIFLSQKRKCNLSGVDICFSNNVGRNYSGDQTASLDRIDSSLGYIEKNLQWVHKSVNRMKLDTKESEFLKWCHLISDYKER